MICPLWLSISMKRFLLNSNSRSSLLKTLARVKKNGGWNCHLINYFQLLFLIKCMVSLLCEGGCVATVLVLPERTHSVSSSSKCHIPASTRHVTTSRRTKRSLVREKVSQSALKPKMHRLQALEVQQRKRLPSYCLSGLFVFPHCCHAVE